VTHELEDDASVDRREPETGSSHEAERERLQAILDALPVAVGITDAEGRVLELNAMVERIWAGASPMPTDVSEYGGYVGYWPETGRRLEPEEWTTARVLRSGEPILGEMIEIQRFDGTRGTVLSSSVPLFDDSGDLVGAIGVTDDITQQYEMRRLSEALNEINDIVHSTLRSDDIMQRSLDKGVEVLRLDAGAIEMRVEDHWRIQLRVSRMQWRTSWPTSQ